MKTKITSFLAALMFISSSIIAFANEPDSAYIFAYSTTKNHHKNGLHFAWSIDQKTWHPVGNEFSFVRSDYSRWGSEKKCLIPYCYRETMATGMQSGR